MQDQGCILLLMSVPFVPSGAVDQYLTFKFKEFDNPCIYPEIDNIQMQQLLNFSLLAFSGKIHGSSCIK